MPARIRPATYSCERDSTTTDSTPSLASRWESSMPAGPAPMIATRVRRSPVAEVVMVRVKPRGSHAGHAGLPLGGSRSGDVATDALGGHLERGDQARAVLLQGGHHDAERGHDRV